MLKSCFNSNYVEAGLDEAGRGCLAGPVVAAAVILPKDYEHSLLNDSKQLTTEQRLVIEQDILKDAIDWAVGEVSHQEIDEINILRASFLAMHRAVQSLKMIPEHLLVDGNRFVPYPLVPHTCIIKGDALFCSIAAASVLAKNHRDRLMIRLAQEFPQYGWEHNVGYPTIKHREAIRMYGVTPFHRKSFRLLKEEISEVSEKSLL